MVGSCLTLRGRKVRVDDKGFVSLDDLYNVARCPKGKTPFASSRRKDTIAYLIEAHSRVTSGQDTTVFRTSSILKIASVDASDSWAHPLVAASYAGFLNPKLEVEINEVWLRYKSGDETLADEVRRNAKPQPGRWAQVRQLGRDRRKDYTASLANHGVEDGRGYAKCTNETYRSLFGATAAALRERKAVSRHKSLRDAMTSAELSYLAAAETLAAERIEDENPHGTDACAKATRRSSNRIRDAIMADRADRMKPLCSDGGGGT